MSKFRTNEEYLRIFNKIKDKFKHSLLDWDLGDINRASKGGAKMGVFILGSCFIDHLACFYYGQNSSERNYTNFVNKFLPMYNGRELYKSMRCKLVHNYSVGGKYAFTHNHHELHLEVNKDGIISINLRSFINDLETAQNKYFGLLQTDDKLKINVAKRYINVGMMQPVGIAWPKRKT